MKRALISVSDKTGLLEFVKELTSLGYEIISTGGTKKHLDENGVKTISIDEVTGFPEILDGRVKTLHPKVHGGLLARRDLDSHLNQVKENDIEFIDMVVVNLYPFKQTIERPDVTLDLAIENIDIGGPSMLRSAAKNNKFVTVVVDVNDYGKVIEEIKEFGDTTEETRFSLAAKVFRHTANYDTIISTFLSNQDNSIYPEKMSLTYDLKQSLRYGENPHQTAAFYATSEKYYALGNSVQLHGKEMSYNNIQDANAALNILREFDEPCVVAVKHMNPCGVGIGEDIYQAWVKAYESDKVSIYGGIVVLNREVTEKVAEELSHIFLEIVIAPSYAPKALEIIQAKKNIRILTCDMSDKPKQTKQVVSVTGGLLVQDVDLGDIDELKTVTTLQPTEEEIANLLFAMKVCKHVKSNAITVVKDFKTVGVGAGQMNRVGAAEIALNSAKEKGYTEGLILASDAFFPFDDTVRLAKKYNVVAIIQPGGSVHDKDSIEACNELGIKMVFSGMRHFKH